MMNNCMIERIIQQMIDKYAPDARGYYRDKASAMMYGVVQSAHCKDYTQVEDMVRGMCHVYSMGIDMGKIIQERKDKVCD